MPASTGDNTQTLSASDALCFLPATDLAAKIWAREVSPVEAVDAVLDRIEALNPRLNAFCFLHADEARAQARAAEAAEREAAEASQREAEERLHRAAARRRHPRESRPNHLRSVEEQREIHPPSAFAGVASPGDTTRTQNGDVRNDTRDASRPTACHPKLLICRENCVSDDRAMVRRGSTVRVRQRALKGLQIGILVVCVELQVRRGSTVRVRQRALQETCK